MTFKVSHSSLKMWRRCHRQWYYRYTERLRPKRVVRPLAFGKAIHTIVEYNAEGRTIDQAIKRLNEEEQPFVREQEEWDNTLADARMIGEEYLRFWKKEPIRYIKVGDKFTEHEFEYTLSKDITLIGKVDGFGAVGTRSWLIEHKSGKEHPGEDVRMRDLQTVIYTQVIQDLRWVRKVSGVLWDYIRSKPPSIPKLLKDGSLSKANIDTLPSVYEQAIVNAKLDRRHYTDILGQLDEKLGSWFSRVRRPLNQAMLPILMEETRTTAREMMRKGGVDITRNLSRECEWCAYKDLCFAELQGLDADHLRERDFYVRQKDGDQN